MYKKILVPYDKSDPAKNALGAALDLAAGVPGAQITVLSVVDWHDFNAETFKIAYADEGGYDCIVMGHRGLGAVRGMLGSVCYSVLHKTNVPVLIVK